jgi:hypothetical protein
MTNFLILIFQVLYLMLPILIPILIIIALIRLSLASRSSRARIKLLEKDNKNNLMHVLEALEKQIADTVVDLVDDPEDSSLTPDSSSPPSESGSRPGTPAMKAKPKTRPRRRSIAKETKPQHPRLTLLQLQLIEHLNSLKGLQKETAFIDPTVNSHGTIVCRDVKRFKIHKIGEGVVRHWANGFEL